MLRKTLDQFHLARPYLVVVLISIALFWPTWFRLAQEWLQFEQVLAHGLPTFLIFLGLLLTHPPNPVIQKTSDISWLGGCALISSVMLWGLLELVRIDTLSYLMVPVGLLTVCWTLLGYSAALRLVPYVLLFGLSLPIWADIVPFLVALATIMVNKVVSVMGITALIEGANITLPYGRLVIEDGCSGIRYLAVSILVAMVTSILNDYRWKGWLVAVIIGAGLALIVNWTRITALVVIAYHTNMESELVSNHETFGWLVYAAFLIPAMLLVPVHRRNSISGGVPQKVITKSLGFLMLAALIGPTGLIFADRGATSNSPSLDFITPTKLTAKTNYLPIPLELPANMDQQVWRVGDNGWLLLAQSIRTSSEEKLVSYLPNPINTEGWFLVDRRRDGLLRLYKNIDTNRQTVVGEKYFVGQYSATTYPIAKLLQIPATLKGQNQFALIVVQVQCNDRNCDRATEEAYNLISQSRFKPNLKTGS